MNARRDRKYMQRCLDLARRGSTHVSPNPMVGCVIVKRGRAIAEGYHREFGGAHAEVNALRLAGKRARGSTLYVNLEPCVHHGKTPPCVEAIIAAGVSEVVASTKDPNPLVAGKGFQTLRRAGVRVRVGVLSDAARLLNEKFDTFMRTGFPFVGIKVAQTLDARTADARGKSRWITSGASRRVAHRLRSEYEAILVGANTVLRDDPQLTVRLVKGRNPIRIVLDGKLRTIPTRTVFNTRRASTTIFTSAGAARRKPGRIQQLKNRGVRVVILGEKEKFSVVNLLRFLSNEGVSSVLVEGGSFTVGEFLAAKVVRKAHLFLSPAILGGGLPSLSMTSPFRLDRAARLTEVDLTRLGDDLLIEGSVVFQ